MTISVFHYPTHIVFGNGAVQQLPQLFRNSPITLPLLVTDVNLQHSQGFAFVQRTFQGAAIFILAAPDPTLEHLNAGIETFLANKCDGVIAYGGGSSLDIGKMIGFMQQQTLSVWKFEDFGDNWQQADSRVIAPTIAIPTTSGTGSEVGRAAVLTNVDEQIKKILFHPKMMPIVTIADPELTQTMPRRVTLGTGMDAFAHNFEAYCARGYNPLADALALEGMRYIRHALERVLQDPNDLPARGKMMMGSIFGGAAFQKGQGAIHALSHPIGALFHCHHGMTNGTLLPYVMAYNKQVITGKIDRVAHALALENSEFTTVLDWLNKWRIQLGVAHTLGELGAPAGHDAKIAIRSLSDPSARSNPRELTRQGASNILAAARAGDVGYVI